MSESNLQWQGLIAVIGIAGVQHSSMVHALGKCSFQGGVSLGLFRFHALPFILLSAVELERYTGKVGAIQYCT